MQGASKAPAAAARQKELKPGWGKRLRDFKENSPYLLMILPAILVVFLFNYLPIYGVLIAFQDFMPGDKILSDTTIWVLNIFRILRWVSSRPRNFSKKRTRMSAI